MAPSRTALASLAGLAAATALNNGLGRTPALGFSSWYAAPGGSGVTSAFIRNTTLAMARRGLFAAGYNYVNIDEGWLAGRYPGNGSIYEDRTKFPEGMAALGAWVAAQGFKYGLYSCRGTAQCGTDKYSGPGSQGHEGADAAWMVAAGAEWVKIDSCAASQDHATAFAQYGLWRDVLNATGSRVWLNLCGWEEWYSPPDPALNFTGGASLGNSWRISGDGGSYAAITDTINVMATQAPYIAPYGWPDADNILGPAAPSFQITLQQAATQFMLWSLLPTQIILGEDVTATPDAYIAAVTNPELLAINQDDPFVGPAQRIVGGDLTYPCAGLPPGASYGVQALACTGDAAQQWVVSGADGTVRLDGAPGDPAALLSIAGCGDVQDGTLVALYPPGGGGACGGANQQWALAPGNGSLVNPATGKCLDEYMWTTPRVDLWTCLPGAQNEAWAFSGDAGDGTPGTLKAAQSGLCLTATVPDAGACVNVWARPLSDGSTALGMVNNGPAEAAVTCDAACFAAANVSSPGGVRVRDLVARADVGTLAPPYTFTANVTGDGGGAAFKFTPL
jgi:hypothetical protein